MQTAVAADPHAALVRDFLVGLQDELCDTFGAREFGAEFQRDPWDRPAGEGKLQGSGVTALIEDGPVFERAGVAFSDVRGNALPPAATARNPQLAGRAYRAMGVSVVMHPRNPHAPTSHMNLRFFDAGEVWWFGGGFDLTPYVAYEEDIVRWHRAARTACAPYAPGLYEHARAACDEYFFVRHRNEARGVGGIFFDDLNSDSGQLAMPWERCFAFLRDVGAQFLGAYRDIVRARKHTQWSERERSYQLYRRGRYVEFNLVLDRGTLFGLQSGGRTDSILMSMPPAVSWRYRSPDPGLDARLLPYLTSQRGRNWAESTRSTGKE